MYLHILVLPANSASCLAEVLGVVVGTRQMILQAVVDSHLRGAVGNLQAENLQADVDMT
ncbi:hypothetical protein BRE01_60730 [Brevibacillus reuszeri]|uniref:Transposase n=1 Tax=Brevibacillus reuszeri TaxID=54915 RepID=A0ABQ0TX05_9BACL|nr:hypothetical protein BRE01_60730 [Brevibacillus reuszeri]